MKRIHSLSSLVVSKIAAGEVIERPASVVKELLENSIDAGATSLELDTAQGGIDLIRIVDNGGGIHPEDLPLAFTSHATSKLADAEDLFHVSTMGFRGEALASIGGVAQVTLQSRPPELPCGAEVSCNGGVLSAVQPWNGSGGTRIEVRNLFFNTPVRRKFLRAAPTEMGHVSEVFTRLALAHPHLRLTLANNDKRVYELAPLPQEELLTGLTDRIRVFYGKELAEKLYSVDVKRGPFGLRGLLANPACDRGHGRMQYLFVNGRFIRDRSLQHAIQEAYRGLLMTGRYAIVFLFLEIPPEEVDVNVHPTKIEVRFQNNQQMHHLVFAALRDRLREENLTARLQPPQPAALLDPAPWTLTAPPPPAPVLPFDRPTARSAVPMSDSSSFPVPRFVTNDTRTPSTPRVEAMEIAKTERPAVTATRPSVLAPEEEELPSQPEVPSTSQLPTNETLANSKLLQLYDSYIIVETPEGMLVIDQHALHERILFEQLKSRLQHGALEVQRLLVPESIELTAQQAATVLEHRASLLELGLEMEDFGGGTVLLSSYPALLNKQGPAAILRVVVDHLLNQDRPPTREVLLSDLLSLMACHSAVRAGDRLSPQEMQTLLEYRHLAQDTHHCPHGRPTALLFSKQELDRQFKRV